MNLDLQISSQHNDHNKHHVYSFWEVCLEIVYVHCELSHLGSTHRCTLVYLLDEAIEVRFLFC